MASISRPVLSPPTPVLSSDLDASPQLEPNAISHLCATCKISTIFADARNYNTALKLKDGILTINISNILRLHNLKTDAPTTIPDAGSRPSDIAFLFHTSGTSSGLPKPIPQTHYAAVGVLPRLPGGEAHATFSTTPLYHGGIADCLRAWTSGAMIHLYPGTQPVTIANLHRAVNRANSYLAGACPVRYFTSVPYILQMLTADQDTSEHPSGTSLLQQMDLVGVGGAALPPAVGDELAANGVRLISRFGCAECGFLLSSHRDYANDREWSYLRANPSLQPEFYDFEPQCRQDGENAAGVSPSTLFELVVKPEWPHRGKTNRPDGSFATADLFEPHPSIPHAWRYHSRADAQITLVSGKKFDPAPVEGELLASAAGRRSLADVMIFGTGQEAPGMLLFPRWRDSFARDEDVIEDVWPTIETMNSRTQSHARIPRTSLVVVRDRNGEGAVLPKSSKGTILRTRAEEMFAAEIADAYNESRGEDERDTVDVPDGQVTTELNNIFDEELGRRVDPTTDLFAQGVDSVACSRLRKIIARRFFADSDITLPLNIIYDQGTIDELSGYILRCRASETATNPVDLNEDEDAQQQLMLDLVEKYRHAIHSPSGSFDHQHERVVVLTGATGFLGAHMLDLLLQDPAVSKIFCLVRAHSPEDAAQRVTYSLTSRELPVPSSTSAADGIDDPRLVCLPYMLGSPRLGLVEADWEHIARHATVLIHTAWPVNFSLKLRSFEAQLAGLRELLHLRDSTRDSAARFLFVSSTAAVSASGPGNADRPYPEVLSAEPEDASPLGYSRSKWVAENICGAARVSGTFVEQVGRPASSSSSGETSAAASQAGDNQEPGQEGQDQQREPERAPIVIARVGQLCGSLVTGVWNRSEVYPIMLSSARLMGCLPDLSDRLSLSWLPVDLAARAVLEMAFAGAPVGKQKGGRGAHGTKTHVYHVVNPHQEPTWPDLLAWVIGEVNGLEVEVENAPGGGDDGGGYERPGSRQGLGLEILAPDLWVRALEEHLEGRENEDEIEGRNGGSGQEHQARALLHLWRKTFTTDYNDLEGARLFDTRRAEEVSGTMRTVPPLRRENVVKMWKWIQGDVSKGGAKGAEG